MVWFVGYKSAQCSPLLFSTSARSQLLPQASDSSPRYQAAKSSAERSWRTKAGRFRYVAFAIHLCVFADKLQCSSDYCFLSGWLSPIYQLIDVYEKIVSPADKLSVMIWTSKSENLALLKSYGQCDSSFIAYSNYLLWVCEQALCSKI